MTAGTEQPVVFAHTAEGLFWKTLRPRIDPALKTKLAALGADLDGRPKDVPRDAWEQMLRATVESLYPTLPPDAGYFELGCSLLRGYNETLTGKALLSVLRVLGPMRGLKRMTTNLKMGNNYNQLRLVEHGPARVEVWVNECNGNPHYVRGVIFEGLRFAGAKDVRVEARGFDGHACTYDLSWA